MSTPGPTPKGSRACSLVGRVLAALAGVGMAVGFSAAAAPQVPVEAPDPPSSSSPPGGDGTTTRAELTLVEQSFWVAPDGDFFVRLSADAPPGATVELTVHDRPVGRDQFRQELLTGPARPAIGRACAASVAEVIRILDPCVVPLDGTETTDDTFTLAIGLRGDPSGPADRLLLDAAADGAYPVVVLLRDADGAELDRLVTHLLRAPLPEDDSPPLDVSLVVPLTAPVALQPDGTTVVAADDRARLAAAAGALAGQPGVPLVVSLTPETLDALAADEDGQDLLGRLADALEGRQVVAGPYVDVDSGAWWAEGMEDEHADLLEAGTDTVARHLGVVVDNSTVHIGATTDGATLARLRTDGADDLIVPQGLLTPLDDAVFGRDLDRPFLATTDDEPPLPALLDDAALSSHLGTTGDPRLDAHQLLADLTVLYSQYPGIPRGVAASLPSDAAAGDVEPFLTTVLAGLADSPVLAGATPGTIHDRAEQVRTGGSDDRDGEPLVRSWLSAEPPDLGDYPRDRRRTEQALLPYRAMAGDTPLPEVDLLLRVSGARSLAPDRYRDYLEAALAHERGRGQSVVLPEAPRVTLTVREGLIPVELRNDGDRPANVHVTLRSDKLDFPDGDSRLVTLPPGPTRLEWLVRTRATGAFPVEVIVSSPDGAIELDRTRFTLRSTAVPGVGIALSALAAVVLAIWWGRHWHTTKKARRLV